MRFIDQSCVNHKGKVKHMEFFQDISKVPLSKVVMLHIKNAILSGKLKNEEKIPTERELASGFNVSRNMVREAIRALEMAGYLHS